MQEKKTSLGLDEHLEGLLCYAGMWVTGIIFLILEPDNRFIRFHSIQSIVTFGILTVGWGILAAILAFLPFIGPAISALVGGAIFALWIAMMYRAFQGHTYKLPFAGNIAERYAGGKPS